MVQVYATGNGAIRARIDASGAALALFRVSERNRIIRQALEYAGNMWLFNFKPLRFTEYVQRKPFSYPKRPVGLATFKLRSAEEGPLFDLWQQIKLKEFRGWDPWSPFPPPKDLEAKYLATNRSRFTIQSGRKKGGVNWKEMLQELRKWAKNRTREYAANLAEDGVMLPLVLTGTLRDEYSKTARARAVSTAKKARLTITIPRGDRQNKWAVRILGMLPVWEFNAIVKWFDKALADGLNKALTARFQQSADGRSVGAGKPRSVGAGTPRSTGAAA